MPFDGLRVLSLESRRSAEIERLIRAQRGVPFVAPSMREIPLEDNPQALEFASRLFGREFDMIVFLTGVGTRLLNQVIETRYPPGEFAQALRQVTVVARGSKPMAVLREWGVPVAVSVPEPNTRHQILAVTASRPENRIAIQADGKPTHALAEGLRHAGATVTTVPVYQWGLPEDTAPLREAVRRLAAREFDVILLTTSTQVAHLMQIAAEEKLEGHIRMALASMVVASVGPSTTETLREYRVPPDFEPSHP